MQASVQDYAIGGILHGSLLLHRIKRVLTSSARDPNGLHNIYLGGAKLNKQENTKYSGVVLDEHLSWAVHVKGIGYPK